MKKILIIDDDHGIRISLSNILKLKEYRPTAVPNAQEGISEIQKTSYDVVILDMRLPDMNGLECLKSIKKNDPDIPVIMLTAYGDIKTAIEAMKSGAFDYLNKPISNDEILMAIEKAQRQRSTERELSYLRRISRNYDEERNLVIENPQMKSLFAQASHLAQADYSVLITGETGVGKEMLARFIHDNSKRKNGPLIIIDCGSLPESLIESELFGYEKGAFTGADKRTIGKIELADGGTLVLDEIGNLPLSLQTKFLRFLEQKSFYRLGGSTLVEVDVRFIAATNISPEELITQNKFRADLYYRLGEYKITIPSLRERKEDIIPLVDYFIRKTNRELGKSIKTVTPEAKAKLLAYSWPGNVRELHNVIRTSAFFADEEIGIEHIEKKISGTAVAGTAEKQEENNVMNMKDRISKIEKEMIQEALRKTNFNKDKAAKLLSISRKTLYAKLKQFNLDSEVM